MEEGKNLENEISNKDESTNKLNIEKTRRTKIRVDILNSNMEKKKEIINQRVLKVSPKLQKALNKLARELDILRPLGVMVCSSSIRV